MSETRLRTLVSAFALTACGGGSSGGGDPDASAVDAHPSFPCMTDPMPTTAPGVIQVSGLARSVTAQGQEPVAGATVRAHDANGAEVGAATTDTDGAYAISLTTGGAPIDGYLHAVAASHLETYLYPPNPMFTDTDDGSLMFLSSGTFALLALVSGVTQDSSRGFVAGLVLDCSGAPVAGATVSTDPPGTVVYADTSSLPDTGATATSETGIVFIFNVPVGVATIRATADGAAFRAHPIEVRATGAQITTTAIAPGPVPQP
jgi:hypothetical protein